MSLGPTCQSTPLQCQEPTSLPGGAVGQEDLWGQAAPLTLSTRTGCKHNSPLPARRRTIWSNISLSSSLRN